MPLSIRSRYAPGLLALTASLLAAAASAPAQPKTGKEKPDNLIKELRRQSPALLKKLREEKVKNVGVLKFQVEKDGKLSDNVGPINLTLARRLELALILASDAKEAEPIGIIRNPSSVAALTRGANHLTDAGRAKLFGAKYPLAWGSRQVSPDAFITGVAVISRDRNTMTVRLNLVTRGGEMKEALPPFSTAIDLKALTESGDSFNLRGLFDGGKVTHDKEEEVVAAAQKTAADLPKDKKTVHPVVASDAPVILEIRYNGQLIDVETVDGKARVREPQQGETVTLVIRKRNPKDGESYGVCVKVNCQNTLYKEKTAAELCQKWLLLPDWPATEITGFQTGEMKREEFKVLSAAESAENEINYGDDVGTISMVVFKSLKREIPKDLPPGGEKEGRELAVLTRGTLPGGEFASLKDLKDKLNEDGKTDFKTRGIIEGGISVQGGVERKAFSPDPVPVISATVFYYKPQKAR